MDRTPRRPRLRAVVALCAGGALVVGAGGAGSAVASPAAVTCEYLPGTHRMRVLMVSDSRAYIMRELVGDQIHVNEAPCLSTGGTAATVHNVDEILVAGDAGEQDVYIDLEHGPFAPGFSGERAGSPEIEFALRLGDGGLDGLVVFGSNQKRDRMRWGELGINLNAGESTGIDADVQVSGIETLTGSGEGENDFLSASGGKGTGGALPVPIILYGDDGNDVLIGGLAGDLLRDEIGGDDSDILKGMAGGDTLDAIDGDGNDEMYGGAGGDGCQGDPGDVSANC